MKIVAIVQARMGSIRLKDKVLKEINKKTIIELLLARLSKSKKINKIVVATSSNRKNLPLYNKVKSLGYDCTKGSEDNVLERYYKTAKMFKADIIIRITGDCPIIDPRLIDKCIDRFNLKKVDYLSNTIPATFPDGLDIEIFTFSTLKKSFNETKNAYNLEHVTTYMKNSSKFKLESVKNKNDLSNFRWTLDEDTDFKVIKNIFNYFAPNIHFKWQDVAKLETKKPQLFKANKNLIRNEGSSIGRGQKLWKKAKQVIPGGNMFLSKRSEMFLPNSWPSYYSKAKGCKIWDLEGKQFIDMSLMGVGTNTLGYANSEIDREVSKIIALSNMSSLNCPEEVYLAEKLIELHDWSHMARFARSGGEANAISIRIARAASGKDNVAVCGYHGWHDWYLASNISNKKNLDNHLLPDLSTRGVPKNLKNSIYTFNYNDYDHLEKLVKTKKIGTIKMEVRRNLVPKNNFLKKVRKLADDFNIILIFDECTSGFRETYGGIHKKYGVNPDMATFGKAIGNGYGITAVLGKREIMEVAQSSFISSTFWSERIGPTAALKTLEVMKRLKSWEIITSIGKDIEKKIKGLSNSKGIKISQSGLPSLTGYTLLTKKNSHVEYKTYITQEMLKAGFLASNSVYACINHTPYVIKKYFQSLDKIFDTIKKCENETEDLKKLLKNPISHNTFKRLN